MLFEARAKRVRPGRDDKVLADWNGLAIAALARAAAVFGRPDWLARAEEAQDFVLAEMSAPDGRVQHAWRLGRVTAAGLLDDQASMARRRWRCSRRPASRRGWPRRSGWRRRLWRRSRDGTGGFFTTAADATDVPLTRPRTAADNATPAGIGLLAEVFARLWHLTGEAAWRERAEALLRAFTGNPDQLAVHADAAGGGGSAGGGSDGGASSAIRRIRAAGACRGSARCAGSGGRGAAHDRDPSRCRPDHPAFGKPAGSEGARPMSAAATCAACR